MDFLRSLFTADTTNRQTTQNQPSGTNRFHALRVLTGYSRLIILLGIVLIAGLWSFVWYQINYDYDRTINEASRETMNLTIAFEELVRSIIAEAAQDLLTLKKAYEKDGIASPVLAAYVANEGSTAARNQVAIINDQGTVVLSFNNLALATNIADREYFQAHSSPSTGLYIGKPIEVRTSGQTTIPLTRRLNNPDGSFAGIVYIGLKADYFLDFYKKMNLGQDQLLTLIGLDWIVRVRQSGDRVNFGQDVTGKPLWRNIQSRPAGTYITTGEVDAIPRIVSYRVMPEYPLLFAVGKSTQVALAEYESRKQAYLAGASVISLFLLVFCGLLGSRAAAQQAFNRQLDNAVQELQLAGAKLTEQAELLDFAHDYILVRDLDSKIIYLNRAAESGYGWPASEAIGQETHSLLETQFPAAAKYDIMASLLTDGRWDGELIITRKDGRQIIVQSHQTLNRDTDGNPVAILEINHDVTAQKNLDAELARLDRLNIIGEMAASIGHEVRNPLTTVRGYLQMFQRKHEYHQHRQQFKTMIEELDRANLIISEFLSLAKNKAVFLKRYNLNDIVSILLPLLQADAFRTGHDLQIEMGDIPDIDLDEREIRQLFLNLVRNGMDATPPGGRVTIKTELVDNKVVLTVEDTGHGIPPEIFAKLGTPFVTTKENGTGLGLAVCYRIADRHNAKIEVDTSSAGTTFEVKFNLPA
ncbi:MAG: ATP-binding protein [Negativicutes bacterium]|nr:ATP-binding protein [Negativicutes bacterium]